MKSSPLAILVILVAFVAAAYATVDVMTGHTGPLAVAAKWVGIIMTLVCFLKPKTGLVWLSFMCFYGDFYKKLAVCYGSASMDTVIEVLAVNMAAVGALIAGSIVQMRSRPPQKGVLVTLLVAFGITGLLMLTSGPLTSRVQMAVNGGLYLGVAAVVAYQYPQPGSSLKLSRFQYLLGIPWVLMACWQYIYGFADMDWYYAKTFLSPVYSVQFFQEDPRVFGLAGTASAFGAIVYCCLFGLWSFFFRKDNRLLYLLGSVIYLAGLVVSTQRTILLMPVIVFAVMFMFHSRARTKLFYATLIPLALALIASSAFLLSMIGQANDSLVQTTGESGWASNVVRLGTYSDRLKGWTRLTKLSSYSLFGTGTSDEPIEYSDEEFAHDAINSILKNFGVVGLALALVTVTLGLKAMHRAIQRVSDPQHRHIITFVAATVSVTLLLTAGGGSNLHTVPFNLLLATLLGHALALFDPKAPAARQTNVRPPDVRARQIPFRRSAHPMPAPAWTNQTGV